MINIIPATREQYINALKPHFARFSEHEKRIKGVNLFDVYLKNAKYNYWYTCYIPERLSYLRMPAYIVVNSGIEYDLPHTVGNIIVIPEHLLWLVDDSLILHELQHIYDRYHAQNISLCSGNMIFKRYIRPKFPLEITNPDTYGYYALYCSNFIIFPVLEDATGQEFTCEFYTEKNGKIYKSTDSEISLYNKTLPFSQNYHPLEIKAIDINLKI